MGAARTKFGFCHGEEVRERGTGLRGFVTGFNDKYVLCNMGRGDREEEWGASSLEHCDTSQQNFASGGVTPAVSHLGEIAGLGDSRSSEQIMVDLIREDLGVTIEPQAWRMFIRSRFGRISPLAHRIHDGKR